MYAHLLLAAFALGQPANDLSATIDPEISTRWNTEKLKPADKTGELEFLRRASLDLVGRIPTLPEQDAFLKEPPEKRRRQIIDRLLAHDDFAHHWANLWTGWLMGTAGDDTARHALHGWMRSHFAKGGSHAQMIEKLLLAKGTPSDSAAVHFFLSHRGQLLAKEQTPEYGQYDMFPLTARVFRTLHAKRLGCVQCHDHAFGDDIDQSHFHQMNLFFKQVRFKDKSIDDDPELNKKVIVMYQRLTGLRFFGTARFYDKGTWTPKAKQTRREFFVEHFVKHPDFARGHVSFLWAQLLGRGLTQSREFDDLGTHNPIVHPKVMDALAAEFVKSGHDSKAILRAICNSNTYALKSVANRTNDTAEKDVFFSRVQARKLSRHQLAEAVAVALTGDKYSMRRGDVSKELLKKLPRIQPRDVEHCDIEPIDVDAEWSIEHSLWLLNSDAVQRELASKEGTLAQAFALHGPPSEKTLKPIVTHLFRAALCRPPTPQEMSRLTDKKLLEAMQKRHAGPGSFWQAYGEDILWALVNTAEFGLNH